ncbi:MAG: pyrroloquinoline quinone-dependent dehydrogenase [Vicinamibacterales bacterium]
MKHAWKVAAILGAVAVAGSLRAPLRVGAQGGVKPGEWRYYGGDSASTKYSPLDQINRQNVKDLQIVWRWKAQNFGAAPEYNLQATPLMINGVLYTTAGSRRDVVAIDAATGETLWLWRYDEGQRGLRAPRHNHRGVSYWTDGRGDERILYLTPGYRLIALDAKNGRPITSFGTNGVVDLYEGLDRPAPADGAIGASSPPMIVKDTAVIGAALLAFPSKVGNIAGHVRGFDVRTGKRKWIFHTIPTVGEFGNETWENDSWAVQGNTAVWAPMSADQDLGYVYLPVETPTNDYYGGHRLGNNLFAESLVCLDANTGKRVWHYQLVHHGVWDYDTVAPPILLDIKANGRTVKAVAQVTKQAFTYVFDRVTGQPVWPIEERPVEASKVPGERLSPTQPFPTKPPAFDRQGVTLDDLNDLTPELKAEAVRIAQDYKMGPIYSAQIVAGQDGKRGLLMLPSATGGANWQGGAADPETGMLYVSSGTQINPMVLVNDPARSEQNFVNGNAEGPAVRGPGAPPPGPRVFGPQGLPMVKPPWGRITAIDLNAGDIKWQVANGDAPDWVKNHPALKGVNVPRTGRYEHVGLLVTKTLLFAGEGSGLFAVPPGSGGPMFRAHDKMTGEIISEFKLPANQSGIPMTYMVNNRQLIVVAVGAQGVPAEFVALGVN